MKETLIPAKKALHTYADPARAIHLQRFFKTGKGEYAEGDQFIGVTVPAIRKVVRQFRDLPLSEAKKLLKSSIHEERLLALLILVHQYKNTDESFRKRIFNFYLSHLSYVNNWDLVDVSCRDIIGGYLENKNRKLLYQLAKSKRLWDRRVAIISTYFFIRKGDSEDTLKIASLLLKDKEDLIHKAVGWMLREVGKQNERILEDFLNEHSNVMPRTMLRYAIERLSEKKRQQFRSVGSTHHC
ncbi:MAG: DNA alkylation repair protein [Deltaproteobacteria bacterium]|nr:DNA alkylation repair protein [Deltaproteobacteria bacterium]